MYTVARKQPRDISYELIQYGEIREQNAAMGDLLSRMWGHFGKPQNILFEGYIYNIKDKKTGLDFLVSYGASGPAYLAEKEHIEKLKPTVVAFEEFLATSRNVDCEIEVDTDFGIYLCGAKNGVPYDKEKEKDEKWDLFNSGSAGNQYYDDLILNIRNSMESHLKDHKLSLSQNDIEECITYLNAYIITILSSKTVDEGHFALKMTVIALNNLNERCENNLIENHAGKQIISLINIASQQMRYSPPDEDLTEEWREW